MIYQISLKIPAQTSQVNPTTEELTLPHGKVSRVGFLFPTGCAGLAHVVIYHNETQVWPTTPGQSFIGDGHLISFEEKYDLPEAWNRIVIKGWNRDDSYSHTITIWIGVLPYEETWSLADLLGMPRYEG